VPPAVKQRPRRGLAGVLYARTHTARARALGGRGLESARHALTLGRDRLRNLYQIAHSERRWKSGITPMSKRIDKSWSVFISIENFEHNRCVDLFSRPDGSYGFEEFRRDVEDQGRVDAGSVLLSLCLYVEGSHACSGNAIRGVVGRRDPAKPLRTKIAAAKFKLTASDRESAPSGTTPFPWRWPLLSLRVFPFEQTHLDNARQISGCRQAERGRGNAGE
jgi:hypothetical protein